MMRPIDADNLKSKMETTVMYGFDMYIACGVIDDAPTIDVVPVKHGHWIIIDDVEKFIAKCSVCGRVEDTRQINDYPYCHCGAKMDGGAELENEQ